MSGARKAKNVDLCQNVFDRIEKLFPKSTDTLASAWVLLGNVYAASGDMEKASEVRKAFAESGLQKHMGESYIAVNGQSYVSSEAEKVITSSNVASC